MAERVRDGLGKPPCLQQLFSLGQEESHVHLGNSTAPNTLHRAGMGVGTRGELWGIQPLPLPRGCLFSRADPQSPTLPHAVGTQERGTSDSGPLPACNPLPHGK